MIGSSIIDKIFGSKGNNIVDDLLDTSKRGISDYTDLVGDAIEKINKGNAFNSVMEELKIPTNISQPLEQYIKETDKGKRSAEEFAKAHKGAMQDAVDAGDKLVQSSSKIGDIFKSIGGDLLDAGIGIAVGVAITGIIKGLDALILTADEAKEAMDSAFSDYDDAKNQVADVENELASTNDQITALLQKGRLTFVEDSELKKLQEARKELEIQLDLAEKQEAIAAQKAGDAAITAYNTEFGGEPVSQSLIDQYVKNSANNVGLISNTDSISAMMAGIEQFKKLKEEATDPSDIEYYQSVIDDTTDTIWEQVTSLEEIRSNISAIPEDMRTAEQMDTLDEISDSIDFIYKKLDPDKWKDLKFDEIFSAKEFEGLEDELISQSKAAGKAGISVDDLKNKYPELASAVTNAGLTLQEFVNEINAQSTGTTQAGNSLEVLQQQFSAFNASAVSAINRMDDLNAAMVSSISGKGLGVDFETDEETGLTTLTGDIANVMAAYEGLEDYDPSVLFEKTANGVHTNVQAMRLYEAELEANTKSGFIEQMKNYESQIDSARIALEKAQKAGDTETATTQQSIIDALENQLTTVELLASAYDGATSAYQKWLNAQSSGEEGDMYRNVTESMVPRGEELYKEGRTNSNEFRAIAQYFSDEDLSTATQEEVVKAWEASRKAQQRYFKEGREGVDNFVRDIKKISDAGDLGWVKEMEDGSLFIDTGSDEEIAKRLGISVEAIQSIFRLMSEYSDDIKIGDTSDLDNYNNKLKEIQEQAKSAQDELKKLQDAGKISDKIDLDFDISSMNISEIDSKIKELTDLKNDKSLNLDTSELEEIDSLLESLNARKEQLSQTTTISVDINGEQDVANLHNTLNNLPKDETTTIGININNEEQLTNVTNEIKSVPEDTPINFTFSVQNQEQADALEQKMQDIQKNSGGSITYSINVDDNTGDATLDKSGTITYNEVLGDTISVEDKSANVNYNLGTQAPPEAKSAKVNYSIIGDQVSPDDKSAKVNYDKGNQDDPEDKSALVNYELGSQDSPLTKTAKVNYILGSQASPSEKTVKVHYVDGDGSVNGTAHANGSTLLSSAMTSTWRDYTRHKPNGAYVGGDWGIPYDQTALVGELQPELLVRNGKWQLIGANGAEFVGLRKGDIIFNHKQTEQLFKNGYVTGRGQPIGFTSHVQGTANAYSSGSWNLNTSSGSSGYKKPITTTTKPKTQSQSKKTNSAQQSVKKVEEAADDFAETMDYVAIAIQRATDEIEIHQSIANDLYQTFRNQNPELDKAISQSNEQLKLLQRAYDKYILQANASGLADSYKTKIQNGALDISEITDENLYNQIEEYQKWYDEAQNIRKEIIDLGASLRDLNVQKLENIADDFERVISYKDALYDTMDALNSLNELKGVEASVESLREMMGIQTDIAGYYQGQAEELQKQFDKLKGTAIDINNDDYWDWVTKIQECASNAYEAEQAVYELKEQIFDIQFTKPLEDTISQLELMQGEIETLSDLIDDNTLFSDNGSLENAGLAKLALLGKQLGNSKQQAAEYAEALKTLKKNLDNGNITQDKYNELLADYSSSQQQAVSDTKAAMDAIIELNTDGIQKAVDAYTDLIDIRIKDKQAMKDYKDQQDNLMDKQSEINSVDAQIAAIRGDESQSQRLKQLLEQRSQLQKEYDDMVQENKYNAEIQGYEDAKELAQQNADEEIALIQSSLEKQNAVIEESLQLAQENYDEVFTYLGSIADVYGLSLQTNIVDSWKDAESAVNAYIEATSKAQAQAGTSSDKIDVPASKPTTTTPSKESSVDKVVNTNPVKQPNKTPSSSGSSGDSSIWKGIKVNTAWKHKSGLNQNVSIYDRIAWNGYQPGWSSQKQLFQNLGGSGTYKGTASQNSWMVQQLKSRGFAQGGIGSMIEKSGEDGVAIVRKGEGFVAPEHVSAIKDLLDVVPKLTEITKSSIPTAAINSVRPVNVQLQYDSLVNVEGNLAKDAVPSLEKITDMAVNKMVRELKNISFTPGFRGLGR